MTHEQISMMEEKLHVTLPTDYKNFVAAFPWPEYAGGTEFSLWDDANLNIKRTLEYRQGYAGAPPWPPDYVHISDDDDACPYALRCSDGTIVKTNHGNLTARPLARFASVEIFVRNLKNAEQNEKYPKRRFGIAMRSLLQRFRWLFFVLVIGVTSLAVINFLSPSRTAGGGIRDAWAVDTRLTSGQVIRQVGEAVGGQRPPSTIRWRDPFSTADCYLRFISPAAMEWSLKKPNLSGYVYFNSTDAKRGAWEFAPCARRDLGEVTLADAQGEFYGKGHPEGTTAFGQNWRTNTIVVQLGDLFLARQANESKTVYALKVADQKGDKVHVRYLEIKLPSQ